MFTVPVKRFPAMTTATATHPVEIRVYMGVPYAIRLVNDPLGYQILVDDQVIEDVRNEEFHDLDTRDIVQLGHEHAEKRLGKGFP